MIRKADISIGKRANAAVFQLFPDKSTKEIAEIIGCTKQSISWWGQGETPSGVYLQRLALLGADIDWILTGRRKDK